MTSEGSRSTARQSSYTAKTLFSMASGNQFGRLEIDGVELSSRANRKRLFPAIGPRRPALRDCSMAIWLFRGQWRFAIRLSSTLSTLRRWRPLNRQCGCSRAAFGPRISCRFSANQAPRNLGERRRVVQDDDALATGARTLGFAIVPAPWISSSALVRSVPVQRGYSHI